jgi:hypothetical protein
VTGLDPTYTSAPRRKWATIRERITGNWEVRARHHAYKTVSRTFNTEKEAPNLHKIFEMSLAGGGPVPADPAHTRTLKQVLDDYKAERKELRAAPRNSMDRDVPGGALGRPAIGFNPSDSHILPDPRPPASRNLEWHDSERYQGPDDPL